MTTAIFIEGTRQGYTPEQVQSGTATIRQLIDLLEDLACECGDDTRVFIQNDRGYTFGEIGYSTITCGEYDEDGDEYNIDIWG